MHDRVTKVFQGSGSSTRSSALPYIGTVIGMEAMDSELGEDVHGDVTTLFKLCGIVKVRADMKHLQLRT